MVRLLRVLPLAGVVAVVLLLIGPASAHADFGYLRSIDLEQVVDPGWPTNRDIALDVEGNLYVTWRDEVQKYDPSGALVARFRPSGGVTGFIGISAVAVDDSRAIVYAGAPQDGLIYRFRPSGAELEPLALVAYEIAVDPRDGSLYTVPTVAVAKLSAEGELLVHRDGLSGELDIANGRLFTNSYGNLNELDTQSLAPLWAVPIRPGAYNPGGGVAVADDSVWISDPWAWAPALREFGFDGVLHRECPLPLGPQPPPANPSSSGESLARAANGSIYVLVADRVDVYGEDGEPGSCRSLDAGKPSAKIGRLVMPRTAIVAGRRLTFVLVARGDAQKATFSFLRVGRKGGRRLVGGRVVALTGGRNRLLFSGPRPGQRFGPGRYVVRVALVSDGKSLDQATRRFRVRAD